MEKNKNTLSMRQAAILSKCTVSAISALIKKKRLRAEKDNGQWWIQKEDLFDFWQTKYSRSHSRFEGELLFDKKKGEYSASEAAKEVRINVQRMYHFLRTGKVPFKKRGSAYVIHIQDILAFKDWLKNFKN